MTGLTPGPAALGWLIAVAGRATLLLIVAALVAIAVRRRPAATRHLVWALGVAAVLGITIVSAAVSAVPGRGALPSVTIATPSFAVGPTTATTARDASGEARPDGPAWPGWPAVLAIGWALGTLGLGLRLVRSHRAAAQLWRAADPAIAASWRDAARDARARLGVTEAVELRRSAAIPSPMTVGVWGRGVMLPASADAWSSDRLRAVLLHELGHVQRRDTAVQLGAQLVCALYWWNPLAHLAAARLRREREQACDDLVVASGVTPSSYATDLLEVARGLGPTIAQAGAIGVGDRAGLATRIDRILDPRTARDPLGVRSRRAAYGATVIAALALACTSTPQAAPRDRDQTDARCFASLRAPTTARPTGFYAPPALSLDERGPRAVEISTMTVGGGLEPGPVEHEIRSHLAELERCYARRLAARPGLAGAVVMHWSIGASGQVVEQCLTEDTVEDPELRACVDALVRATRYPAPRGGAATVSYPFVFAPAPGC